MREMKQLRVCMIFLSLLQPVFGQGFVNLNFESSLLATGGPPNTVATSSAFPGWTVLIQTNSPSSVLYNNATLGSSAVAILAGGSSSPVSVFNGKFSALLISGFSGDASLSQTGLVPTNANSLLIYANLGPPNNANNFLISIGGQTIPMIALENYVSYSYVLYAGDVSSFAGQITELKITSLRNGGLTPFALDDIRFSTQSVPEPREFVLLIVGAILFCRRIGQHKQ